MSPENLIEAHRTSIDFHEQEMAAAEERGMPETQVSLHRFARNKSLEGLAELGVAEMISSRPELPEPEQRRAVVPALAMPEFAAATA